MAVLKYRDPGSGLWYLVDGLDGISKHSYTQGLGNDDHPQYLLITGGTVTGALTVDGDFRATVGGTVTGGITTSGRITNLAGPTNSDDIVTKQYFQSKYEVEEVAVATGAPTAEQTLWVDTGSTATVERSASPFEFIVTNTNNVSQSITSTTYAPLPNTWTNGQRVTFTLAYPGIVRFDLQTFLKLTGPSGVTVRAGISVNGAVPDETPAGTGRLGTICYLACNVTGNPVHYQHFASTKTYTLATGSHSIEVVGMIEGAPTEAYADYASLTATFLNFSSDPLVVSPTVNSWESVTLNWAVTGITPDSYTILRNSTIIATGVTGTTYTDPGRMPGTTYTYEVRAIVGGATAATTTKTATTPARRDMGLTSRPLSATSIELQWSDPDQGTIDTYKVWRGSTLVATLGGGARLYNDTGLAPSTNYTYTLEAYRGGVLIPTSDNSSSSTLVAPTTQKTWTGNATTNASYDGSNSNRGVAELYCGYFSSTNGNQKSLWYFAVPTEIRGCVSIDKVELSVYSRHHFLNSGGKFGVVVHHGSYPSSFPGTFPGSTGIFVELDAPKPGWLGGAQWVDVTNYTTPGRTTVKEEFRTNTAWGFGLAAPSTSTNYYGYADGVGQTNPPAIRITYTIAS